MILSISFAVTDDQSNQDEVQSQCYEPPEEGDHISLIQQQAKLSFWKRRKYQILIISIILVMLSAVVVGIIFALITKSPGK